MTGLVKAKKYDWKDSNMALFGSDTEKQVKKESAESEPAWRSAGKKPGIQIWRIVKFKIESWPEQDYGRFYSGDSYIILNTYMEKDSEELLYDVHFWIGAESTQDEYGTAAYKTVELDTLLDDKPIQHREVQDHESNLFRTYFKNITYMKGGADTGFRKVKPTEYKTRILRVQKKNKQIRASECKVTKIEHVLSDDVFILDKGLQIYIWKGKDCSKDESFKATQIVSGIKSDRNGKPAVETLDEALDGRGIFEKYLRERTEDDDDDDDDEDDSAFEDNEDDVKQLFRLTDSGGKLEFENTRDNEITKSDFKEEDVFLFDTKEMLYVWIGKRASENEKKNAMAYAHTYLQSTTHPLIPVTCMNSGSERIDFRTALAA